jgi:hypothetical protein
MVQPEIMGMATSHQPHPPEKSRQSWLHSLAQYRHQSALALFVATILLALVPAWLFIKYRDECFWIAIATILLPLTTLAGGIWQKLRQTGAISELDATRLLVLAMGGVLGLNLLIISLAVLFQWWQFIAGGLEAWQGSEGWRVWVFLFLLLGGLAIIFLSLQLGRTEERTNPVIRRLLYGYNAVLTGLLLLSILGFCNVLAYAYFPRKDDPETRSIYSSDWSFTSIYNLSSRSVGILEGLKKPTKIYAILPHDRVRTLSRFQGLMDNCRAISPMIQVEYLSPDLDREKISQLAEKYKFTDPMGVLVVYGNEPNTEHQFIQADSLYGGSSPFGQQRENRLFKGESELMTALNYLSQGKQKPVVYFTQGNGELDLADHGLREIDQGAGALKQRLEQDNVTVKGLQFSAVEGVKAKSPDVVVSNTVPKDASVVVVAGPHRTLPDFAVKALSDYMNAGPGDGKTKGKLFALLGVALTPDKTKMERTGLEDLLTGFGVQVGDNRIMQAGLRGLHPLQVRAFMNPDLRSRNPVAAAFAGRGFLLYNVRLVQAASPPPNRPDANRYRVEPLLLIPAQDAIWTESQLRTDPIEQKRALLKLSPQEIQRKLSQDDLSVGVVVTEQGSPPDPHTMAPTEGTPRLAVIGDASLASNLSIERGANQYDLFYSILSWLRERPSDIGIEAKKQDVYDVDPVNVNFARMVWLPAALMFVGIIGLGAGVWVVRRR